jgi:hypothetical protein
MMGEVKKRSIALIDIAMVKSYVYCMEYDPNSGREVEKQGYHYLKQGYIDGFLDGVAHRFEHSDSEVD